MSVSVEEFRTVLSRICTRETSSDPAGWTPENPLWGHCAVVALLAQDRFGGELLRASLDGTVFAHMRSHYWNRLADGREEDFTRAQFGTEYPRELQPVIRERSYVLAHAETAERYGHLSSRFADAMNRDDDG
jgi:hypothetical protein